jgi:tetraacyldisaccharide 4'-kinase
MRDPAFWWRGASWQARLLAPVAAIYGAVAARRMTRDGAAAGVPVICVGNFHTGGAGKTPAAILVARLLMAEGERPAFLSRGYGGSLPGPLEVDPSRHDAADVGDEPLLLSRVAPAIVARDRVAGARLACARGASVIIMDDGFQSPSLRKDLSLIVIDSRRGVGNGRVFPAGPLRAPLPVQLARTSAMLVIDEPRGESGEGVAPLITGATFPVWRARFKPQEKSHEALRGARVLAFAGIGDPARFFATLRAHGADVVATEIFPDHHPYTVDEMRGLIERGRRDGLRLVTTEKDAVRLPQPLRSSTDAAVFAFAVDLEPDDRPDVTGFLREELARARRSLNRAN